MNESTFYVEFGVVAATSGVTDHSKLSKLDFKNSGHTGFASDEDLTMLSNDVEVIKRKTDLLVNDGIGDKFLNDKGDYTEIKQLVTSVNEKTGDVTIGVPTRLSELTNDIQISHESLIEKNNIDQHSISSITGLLEELENKATVEYVNNNFINANSTSLENYYQKKDTYNKIEMDERFNEVSLLSFEVVDSLPSVGKPNAIYLVDTFTLGENVFNEYIYVNDKYELIGTTAIDLSQYALKSEIPTRFSELTNDINLIDNTVSNLKNYYSKDEIDVTINAISIAKQDKISPENAGTNISITTVEGKQKINATTPPGVTQHDKLTNKELDNQHPINAIIGLQTALNSKANNVDVNNALDNFYAKSDTYTKNEVGNLTQDFIKNTADNLVNYYLKSETMSTEQITILVNSIKTISLKKVVELPDVGESNVIYLLSKSGTESYDEFIYVDESYEKIGSTDVDLSAYALTTDIPTALSSLNNDTGYITNNVSDLFNYYSKTTIDTKLDAKQNKLSSNNSGTNITITEENGVAKINASNNVQIDHSTLHNLNNPNQHEIGVITGLQEILDSKANVEIMNTNDNVRLRYRGDYKSIPTDGLGEYQINDVVTYNYVDSILVDYPSTGYPQMASTTQNIVNGWKMMSRFNYYSSKSSAVATSLSFNKKTYLVGQDSGSGGDATKLYVRGRVYIAEDHTLYDDRGKLASQSELSPIIISGSSPTVRVGSTRIKIAEFTITEKMFIRTGSFNLEMIADRAGLDTGIKSQLEIALLINGTINKIIPQTIINDGNNNIQITNIKSLSLSVTDVVSIEAGYYGDGTLDINGFEYELNGDRRYD